MLLTLGCDMLLMKVPLFIHALNQQILLSTCYIPEIDTIHETQI